MSSNRAVSYAITIYASGFGEAHMFAWCSNRKTFVAEDCVEEEPRTHLQAAREMKAAKLQAVKLNRNRHWPQITVQLWRRDRAGRAHKVTQEIIGAEALCR